jgi:hypothetical protein
MLEIILNGEKKMIKSIPSPPKPPNKRVIKEDVSLELFGILWKFIKRLFKWQ